MNARLRVPRALRFKDLSQKPQRPSCSSRSARFVRYQHSASTRVDNEACHPLTSAQREQLSLVLHNHLFYTPSFSIYQSTRSTDTKGLYDYGPPGTALQANVLALWRRFFVHEEEMFELSCTDLTPYEVLNTSGHVDKFEDLMAKDPTSGEVWRADHLLKEVLESRLEKSDRAEKSRKASSDGKDELSLSTREDYAQAMVNADSYTLEQMKDVFRRFDITSQGRSLTISRFNLMFATQMGSPDSEVGKTYLRPETAQAQFVNFKNLSRLAKDKLPFASASIGKGFRNEVAPRGGLLRTREFLMAEIEHFLDPEDNSHPKLHTVQDVTLPLLSRSSQQQDSTVPVGMDISTALTSGTLSNETLAYFLARTHLFLLALGLHPEKIRYRQHLSDEMAHYASDCWDAEILTSQGWIEAVGLADRAAYDLQRHSERTNESLTVNIPLAEPVEVETLRPVFKFPKNAERALLSELGIARKFLEKDASQAKLSSLACRMNTQGSCNISVPGRETPIELTSEHLTFTRTRSTQTSRTVTPNVVEPSFGISRIIYCMLEHAFKTRETDRQTTIDTQTSKHGRISPSRSYLSLPPPLAPTQVLIAQLTNRDADAMLSFAHRISRAISHLDISNKIDSSGVSIGKRYTRADEMGVPYGITVDFQSLEDGSVTLRDRDSMEQVRGDWKIVVRAVAEGCGAGGLPGLGEDEMVWGEWERRVGDERKRGVLGRSWGEIKCMQGLKVVARDE